MALISFVIVALLAVTLGSGIWINISLFAVGIAALELFKSLPVDKLIAQSAWNTATTPELLALPLFILMGEILFHARLADSLLRAIAPWTTWLPGRLLHVNVIACTLFAAGSGSSAATTATVGRITLTELSARGYNRTVVMGSLAGSGTLGFLIPPSLPMIVYGVLTEQSILKLFLAGFVPGIILAALFSTYLVVSSLVSPDIVPREVEPYTWRERFASLPHLLPFLFLISVVLGSMYGGIATPTEAAVMGILGSLIIAYFEGRASVATIRTAFLGAVRTSSMLGLIIVAASFLSVGFAYLGLPRFVANQIASLALSPYALVALLLLFYIVLGCILEGASMMVMTLPITFPLITQAGFDPIWFGVFFVLVVEMAQVTPPVGFNLFVIQSLSNEPMSKVFYGVLPFFFIMILMTGIVTFFPDLALFIPNHVTFGR
ncbi:MAG: TRAP transporter large permease subunit [Proteobacteria bacterium]|nr:TRAP transporter large permease subunit [Pseudomonadota bacterium]